VRKPLVSRLTDSRNQADYIVIGPSAFLDAARPLLALREGEGLTTMAVPVEEVYSVFGHGESTPQSIQSFLSHAYHNWQTPSVRYVVLLGDATYDFKDVQGLGVVNRVPPLIIKTAYLWTASDPTLAAVNGEDILPDIAIGRLPAATVEEARAMVNKIIAYETGQVNLEGLKVLVADNPDQGGNFTASAENVASTLFAGEDVRKLYLEKLGRASTKSGIRDAFDNGASLVSYIGHGAIHLWADEDLLNIWQVPSLSPQSQQPIVLTMNCLNGYFHFPIFDSLAEALLKAEDRGAIAAFSPSGMSLNEPAHAYHVAVMEELLRGDNERLGDAILRAQETYLQTGVFPELLSIYHLFGDPAMKLGSGVKSSKQ
jgi:hypothetical protein